MSLETFIRAMPKVELHVHLEGSIQPATLLTLAQRHGVQLPAQTVEGLRQWYTFSDFDNFVRAYLTICSCIRTPDDIELIAREFLAGQAAQNIRYSEVTYTAYLHYHFKKIPFRDQLAALNRARAWAAAEHGVRAGFIIDIPRMIAPTEGVLVADWAISGMGDGVVALGLGGPEVGHPPERFQKAFDRARRAGLASVPHAGETVGPESIWGALRALHADRIQHGVRCLEDTALVAELRERQIPLDVCVTSNVCLHVVPTLADHPLPRLLAEGLFVTLNSDDPPLFNTTLTDEYLAIARTFQMGADQLEQLVLNGVRASLLPASERTDMEAAFKSEFMQLRKIHLPNEESHEPTQ
ncbi:MAG: adenosine deaminase [Acidobacteriota bacterium]|nr:adenosine deaminase [Blastocatellia bacterium]MDW8238400.1 adenosine deaminase [Acidobacteriota bacterium]